jgi:hypothetical protein
MDGALTRERRYWGSFLSLGVRLGKLGIRGVTQSHEAESIPPQARGIPRRGACSEIRPRNPSLWPPRARDSQL